MTQGVSKNRFNWYGHVKKREEGHMLRKLLDAPIPGQRQRGRQTTGLKDSYKVRLKVDKVEQSKPTLFR